MIWDHELQRVIGLSAEQALDLLAHLQSNEDWRQEGVVLDTPMTQLASKQPDHPSEHVRGDHIHLSPIETANFLELLGDSEPALHEKAEAEEADKRRRLGQVYTLLLELAAERRARLAREAVEVEQLPN